MVCFDNCTDNKELVSGVSALRKLERQSDNIVLVNYICFEQVVVSSSEITKFIPYIENDRRYHIARQHIETDYTDVNVLRELCKLSQLPKIQYVTTERFFRPLLEENAIVSKVRTTRLASNNRSLPFEKIVMCHHYIHKGSWSRCWTEDCSPDCPDDYCWKTQYDCSDCMMPIDNHTCMRSEKYSGDVRKYEEALQCNREIEQIPGEQKERIIKQMLSSVENG